MFLQGLNAEKARPDIPHIAIILTDGMSQDMRSTLEEAKVVHSAGISVFVIGKSSYRTKETPASILRKSTSGRQRPVSYPDGAMTARYRFT